MNILEEKFRAIVVEQKHCLTEEDVEEVLEMVAANELGVAFENFCTQLFERGGSCSPDQWSRIASVGAAIGITPDHWEILTVK